jgi:hypothetical protein
MVMGLEPEGAKWGKLTGEDGRWAVGIGEGGGEGERRTGRIASAAEWGEFGYALLDGVREEGWAGTAP